MRWLDRFIDLFFPPSEDSPALSYGDRFVFVTILLAILLLLSA
jgi:hypothetical protein